jgi:WD40 repeat protein
VERATIPVAKADALAFSSSGHYFAVSAAALITIFATITRTAVGRLKGHMSTVTAMRWSPDDRTLLSGSAGGAVYFWDLVTMSRVRDWEYVDKVSTFSAVQLCADGKHGVVRATQGAVHIVAEGASIHSVPAAPGNAAPLALVANERMILGGTDTGDIQSWAWPPALPAPPSFAEGVVTAAHGAPLRHLCVAGNGSMLVTAADDGTILVWSMQVRDRRRLHVTRNSSGICASGKNVSCLARCFSRLSMAALQ